MSAAEPDSRLTLPYTKVRNSRLYDILKFTFLAMSAWNSICSSMPDDSQCKPGNKESGNSLTTWLREECVTSLYLGSAT